MGWVSGVQGAVIAGLCLIACQEASVVFDAMGHISSSGRKGKIEQEQKAIRGRASGQHLGEG
jgi:hypothetical protein